MKKIIFLCLLSIGFLQARSKEMIVAIRKTLDSEMNKRLLFNLGRLSDQDLIDRAAADEEEAQEKLEYARQELIQLFTTKLTR